MTDNQYELVQHCIDTGEFVSIRTSGHYLLFHQNVISYSDTDQLNLDLPLGILKQINGINPISINDAQILSHVDSSNYDLIIFADKSIVYTRKRKLIDENHHVKRMKTLPYYVQEDLELLENFGMSKDEIDLFIQKLDKNNQNEFFNSKKSEKIIEKILHFTDIPTRLKCRQVSHQWKNVVDNSNCWNYVKLSKFCSNIYIALDYFQNIDIRELDLSESLFECTTLEFSTTVSLYSLRSLCISTDHPLELFTLLFKSAPFLQHIKLIQTYNSSLKFKNNTNQLYECIHFVISQCQERLKCLRRLHIQLRSVSDQIFLESSSKASIPISYEVINY